MSNLFNHACPLPSCYHSAPCFSVHFKGAVIDLVWLSCTTKRPFCLFTSWGVDAVGHESFAEHHSGGPFIFVTASSHTIDWYAYHHLEDALGLWNPLKRFLVTDSMKPQFCWRWLRFLFWNTYRIPRNSRNWMLLKYIYIYIYTYYTYTILSAYQTQDVDFQFWTIFDVPRHLLVQPPRWKRKTSSIVFTQRQGIVVASRLRSFSWISTAMLGDFSGESSPNPSFVLRIAIFLRRSMCVYICIYIYSVYIYIWRGDLSNLYVMLAFWNGGTLAKLFASWVF